MKTNSNRSPVITRHREPVLGYRPFSAASRAFLFLGGLAILFSLCFDSTANAQSFIFRGVNHDKKKGGYWHPENPEDFDLPYKWHCTDCHAPDLDGGVVAGTLAPSCRACHLAREGKEVLWDSKDAVNLAPPLDHTISKNGDLHKPGFGTPLTTGCIDCHGPNLNDGFAPSCYSCHPRWWAGQGPPVDHTVLLGGTALHKPGYTDPITNTCTQCHGPNLNDGFAPSCYDCHAPADPPHDFTGRSWLDPNQSACTPCHTWADWNHTLSATIYAISSTTVAAIGQPSGSSPKCLSCHEGNVAVDDFLGSLSSDPPGFIETITGVNALGADLTHHHPVSFTYDTALATLQGALNDPTTTPSGLAGGGTIAQDMLDAGQVQCTTCHDPHDNAIGKFLVKIATPGIADAGLCFTCHFETLPAGTIGKHHIPRREDPWGAGMCTVCHGANLLGASWPGPRTASACEKCHNPVIAPNPPPPGHHGGDRLDPYNHCAMCHGDDLKGAQYGSTTSPSCYQCHDNVWELTNQPPVVNAGGPYTGVVDEPVTLDASATFDPNLGDTLTFTWDFGDGSTPQSTGSNPTAANIYTGARIYSGSVTVSDGVNPPVTEPFTVEVGFTPPPPANDAWTVTTTNVPADIFAITIEDHFGNLVLTKDDGVNVPSLAIGVELAGVIFWMDIRIDVSGGTFWSVGDAFFGNINRTARTMSGIVFEHTGGIETFTGTQN